MYSRIRVPARWRVPENRIREAHDKEGVADFQLGLGSCGKVVTELSYSEDRDCIRVFQTCEDGEKKCFIYPRFLLTGRIELTYI